MAARYNFSAWTIRSIGEEVSLRHVGFTYRSASSSQPRCSATRPAVWIEEVGDVSRVQAEQRDIVLHIPLVEALLTVKVLTIEEVLQDVTESEAAAARGRGKEVERGFNARFGRVLSRRLPDEECLPGRSVAP